MVTAQYDHLFWEAHLEREQQTDHLTGLFSSVHVVTQEEVAQVATEDLVLLILLVFVSHFFEHVQQVAVLAVDVTEDLDGCFKLKEWLFIFKYFLYLFQQVINYLLWQVDEWYVLRILSLVVHDFIVQVEDNNVHNEL